MISSPLWQTCTTTAKSDQHPKKPCATITTPQAKNPTPHRTADSLRNHTTPARHPTTIAIRTQTTFLMRIQHSRRKHRAHQTHASPLTPPLFHKQALSGLSQPATQNLENCQTDTSDELDKIQNESTSDPLKQNLNITNDDFSKCKNLPCARHIESETSEASSSPEMQTTHIKGQLCRHISFNSYSLSLALPAISRSIDTFFEASVVCLN